MCTLSQVIFFSVSVISKSNCQEKVAWQNGPFKSKHLKQIWDAPYKHLQLTTSQWQISTYRHCSQMGNFSPIANVLKNNIALCVTEILIMYNSHWKRIFFTCSCKRGKKKALTFKDIQVEVGSSVCRLLGFRKRPQPVSLWPLSEFGSWGCSGRKFGSALQSSPIWRIDQTHQFIYTGGWTQLLLHVRLW